MFAPIYGVFLLVSMGMAYLGYRLQDRLGMYAWIIIGHIQAAALTLHVVHHVPCL